MKGNKSKIAGIVVSVAATVMLWDFIDLLPVIGDPDSAPNTHVSKVYIEEGPEKTHSANLVTGVLADYRGVDTLLETTVIFLSGITVTLIMSGKQSGKQEDGPFSFQRFRAFGLVEIRVVLPIVLPLVLLYAVYVFVHGEVSLGGGFQAGALLSVSYILYCFIAGSRKKRFGISPYASMCIGAFGLLIYFLTGLTPVFFGGKFLEYSRLPLPFLEEGQRHAVGIILVELGVTICVAASLITILEAILERKDLK